MASKRFNLGDYNLPGLSVSAPETEQIKLIPLDLIDPDPNNFYSLEGIDELAANIETVGLLDPLRVRPVGERYTLVSGHRRRAACMLIRDGGSEMFKNGVPSIVERGEASDALRELRLLSANSATRIMSDAELSKQAERMTAVLYQLKQEGYKFPGKMRTIVAQACQVSESKLARLHAIRSRGHEYTVDLFDKGEISESVAYELSKIPTDLQKLFIVARKHDCYRFDVLTANDIREFDDLRKKLTFLKCPLAATPGITCNCSTARIETALHHHVLIDPVPYCVRGKCCKSCPMLRDCEDRCIRCDTIAAQQEAEIERKAEERETARKALDALREQAKAEAAEDARKVWQRIRTAAEQNGVDVRNVFAPLTETEGDLDRVMECATGEYEDTGWILDVLGSELETIADGLRCTTDWLLGRSEYVNGDAICGPTPAPAISAKPPEWQTGEPPEDGWYCCWATWNPDAGRWDPEHAALYWHSCAWFEDETEARKGNTADYDVRGWVPIPGPMKEE